MGNRIDTQVLIVGGGPVGLTLAIDLVQRGIEVTVVEMRAPAEPPSVRCNHVAARTMEIFRRLGLVRTVREAGLPADYPNDVVFLYHRHWDRVFTHPDSVSRRTLYRERWSGRLVADA